MEDIDKLAEEIFEYILANTPDGKNPTWPHSPFATLTDSAKNHYRHAARFVLNATNNRVGLLTNKLAYRAAEFLTQPKTAPHTAVLEAMRYAGLTPPKVEIIDYDGRIQVLE